MTVSLCIACGQPLVPGDPYYQDADGGEIHASCCGPEREGYVNADGDPLGPDDPIPTPMVRDARADRSEEETCRARGEANRDRLHGRQSVYEAASKRARRES